MPPPDAPPAATLPRILAAEDDPTTRRLIEFKLRREGFEVETLPEGEALLARAPVFRPNLILLDLLMPIKNGYSTLCELKTHPELARVPVLMLSGKNQEDDVLRCLNAGAADYMVKPFSPDELVARVRKLLR